MSFQKKETFWDKLPLFQKLNKDEKILFLTREHFIIITLKSFFFIFVAMLLLISRVVMQSSIDDSLILIVYDFFVYITNLVLVGVFAVAFHNYYLSMQIITNERIVDIDQTRLLQREVNEVGFLDIQNVNYKQSGILGLIFDYGDVVIETAGEHLSGNMTSGFVFENVYKPKLLANEISKLYHEAKIKYN